MINFLGTCSRWMTGLVWIPLIRRLPKMIRKFMFRSASMSCITRSLSIRGTPAVFSNMVCSTDSHLIRLKPRSKYAGVALLLAQGVALLLAQVLPVDLSTTCYECDGMIDGLRALISLVICLMPRNGRRHDALEENIPLIRNFVGLGLGQDTTSTSR